MYEKYLAETYKILKQTYFRSVCWYDIIRSCIKYEDISKEVLPKRRIWANNCIISICQRTISIINCAQEGASLITEQRRKCIFVPISRPHKENGFRVSWKLCLNLCSHYWLKPWSGLVRYLIPLQLRKLKTLFGDNRLRFAISKFFF